MKRCITIYSSKGGVGKTTLTLNIAHILSNSGQRVLIVDTDPQNSLSGVLGIRNHLGLSEIFDHPLEKLVQRTAKGFDILPSGIMAIEETNDYITMLLQYPDQFETALRSIIGYYDIVLIDTPPGFSPMTNLAMKVSDTIIGILEADATSYATLELMQNTLTKVKNSYGQEKQIYFVTNKVAADEISVNFEALYRYLFDKLYLFALPFDSNVKVAATKVETLYEYNPNSPLYQTLVQMLKKLFSTP